MIIVSGTKRSGTSMWMQILSAAGLPVLGKAFPRGWDKSALREANPDGFFEAPLRQGIYYRTNPHPVTGFYFLPADVAGYVVKVFVPGVVRSERGYIEVLVANVRRWQEYEASVARLWALEDAERAAKRPDAPEPFRFPAALEWWMENFALIRDVSLRRYEAKLQTYDQVIDEPDRTVSRVLAGLGGGDVARAVAAVKPENRTQQSTASDSVEPKLSRVFDDLYAHIAERKPIAGPFLKLLNDTNQALLPRLRELQAKVVRPVVNAR